MVDKKIEVNTTIKGEPYIIEIAWSEGDCLILVSCEDTMRCVAKYYLPLEALIIDAVETSPDGAFNITGSEAHMLVDKIIDIYYDTPECLARKFSYRIYYIAGYPVNGGG